MALAAAATSPIAAQSWERGDLYAPFTEDSAPPPVAREFRAVWLATVDNIDWPSKPGLPVEAQKAELLALLELARRTRLNAVLFQVRPSADALYPSKLEPWSYFLTGAMGRAPVPAWDPLQFAITEAHRRGIELHAWVNPYRSRHPADKGPAAAGHVSRRAPAWTRKYGPYGWMDPGEPGVRKHTTDVILDIVRRYDVDGVHMDDYFYPYPVQTRRGADVPFPDDRPWRAYQRGGGALARNDWRRQNVDELIRTLYDSVKREKPWVKVGISPFGIWRPGYPSSVSGFDAFDKLYADSRKWLREGWLDYFTPQLYWRLSAPRQPYGQLLSWWIGENTQGRHMWPGNYTGRASAPGRTSWPVAEVFEQVTETRRQLGNVSGNVHFPMHAFAANVDQLVERFEAGPYAEPALVPASPWLSAGAAELPAVRATVGPAGTELRIEPLIVSTRRVDPGAARDATRRPVPVETGSSSAPRWWLVRARYGDGWRVLIADAGTRTIRLAADPLGAGPRYVTVTSVDRSGQESAPVRVP